MKRVLSLLLVLFCYSKVSAQFEYDIRYYGEESGFYDTDEISDIQVDSEGYVWIVSFSGITRYNGTTFSSIQVNHIDHNSFFKFVDRIDNEPYVVDLEGRVYLVRNDSIHAIKENKLIQRLNLSKTIPNILMDENDTIHLSFNQYGSSYTKLYGEFIQKPLLRQSEKFNGTVYLPLNNKGFVFNTRDSIYKDLSHNLNFYILNDQFQIIAKHEIKRGKDLFRHKPLIANSIVNESYKLLSTGRGELLEFNNSKIISSYQYEGIVSIFFDNSNGVWISTFNDGISYYENFENSKKSTKKLFGGQPVIAFVQDIDNNVWIYSKEFGLATINVAYLIQKNKRGENIDVFNISDSKLYYSKNKGELVIEDLYSNQREFINIPELEKSNNEDPEIFGIELKHNNLWLSKRKGVYSLDQSTWKSYDINQLVNRPMYGSRYSFGKTIPKQTGVVVGFKYKTFFELDISNNNFFYYDFSAEIKSVLKQNDTTWLGTSEGLHKCIDFSKNNKISKSYLKEKSINQIEHFDNNLFISTVNNGVFIINNDTIKEISYGGYKLKNAHFGVSGDEIWVFTSLGTFKTLKDSISGIYVEAYEPIDLRSFKDLQIDSTLLIVLNGKGIVKYKLKDIQKKPLKEVAFYFKSVKINELECKADSIFDLKHSENFIEFNYEAISFLIDKVGFRFRLKGLDNKWSNSFENFARYTSLPPGNYTFELQARTGSKPWSDSKIIHINVAKPYWQELWFLTAIAIILTLLIYWFVKSRIKASKRNDELIINNMKAEQRALRAQIDPHFIFNIISSAQYFIVSNNNIKANEFLNMFSSVLRSNLELAGMNTITLKQEIEFIDKYIKLEQFRLEGKFDYEIYSHKIANCLQEEIPQFMLQPFIENAIQHGLKDINGKGLLTIDFELEKEFFKVTIEDNGWGIKFIQKLKEKYNTKRETFGIEITKERLLLYNKNKKSIEIIDLVEEEKRGTRIVIYIKRILL